MKIKFIQSPSGKPYKLGYAIGEEADVKEGLAQDLIDGGYAISTAEAVAEKPKATRKPKQPKAPKA